MKLNIAVVCLVVLSFFSCKNEKSTPETATPKSAAKEVKDDFFKVSFDLIVKKDDNMCLYYTQDGTVNFNEQNTVWIPVKGSDNVQEVAFTLPEDVIPSQIRVDFGHGKNEAQSDVELKTFKMNYKGKKVEFAGASILTYFLPFEAYTKVVPGTSILQRSRKDQEVGPVLYPQAPLSEKINEITAGASPE